MSEENPATEETTPVTEPPVIDPAPTTDDAPTATEPADDLPEWARKSITKANKEAAAYRDAAKQAKADAEQAQQELVQNIGKALGLVKGDEAPTVESLTEALQQRDLALSTSTSSNASLRAENAVLRFAGKHNADADALLDSRDFEKKLAKIDPASDDYDSQVEELVKSQVETNHRYRTVQVAPANSNGTPAPTGSSHTQLTREQFAALPSEERLKAVRDGRFRIPTSK